MTPGAARDPSGTGTFPGVSMRLNRPATASEWISPWCRLYFLGPFSHLQNVIHRPTDQPDPECGPSARVLFHVKLGVLESRLGYSVRCLVWSMVPAETKRREEKDVSRSGRRETKSMPITRRASRFPNPQCDFDAGLVANVNGLDDSPGHNVRSHPFRVPRPPCPRTPSS